MVVEVVVSDRHKLNEWESRLRQDVGEGDLLLGELGYTPQHLEEIGDLLFGAVFYRLQYGAPIDVKLREVFARWPLTFALYLALEGLHHYGDEGLYWHGPKERLKIHDNHTTSCGKLFLDILVKHNLRTFEQSGGFPYVTPILLHGGIPDGFLGEFFDFLYHHEVQPHRIAVDARTLLATWRRQPNMLTGLHLPVSRFLQYGGRVAEDFVARCLDLFRVTAEDEAMELDLPERVRHAYAAWRERQTVDVHSRPLRPLIRLQRPFLTLAPYTTGMTLYLPPQQLPSQNAPRELTWRVTAGGHTQVVLTTRQRIENGYHYVATELLPIPPDEEYVWELLADGKLLEKSALPGVGTVPLIVFDPFDDYEADALEEQERHRPGKRWLLFPDTLSLQATTGNSHQLGQLPRLTGVWQGYCLETWQLEPGELRLLDGNSRTGHRFPVIQERIRKRPYFDGGERLLAGLAHNDFPLYSGQPPALIIHTTQPERWRISMRAAGNAQPIGYRSYVLSNLPLQRQDDTVHLDLADPQLLGSQPIGKFEITVRGPLGYNYSLGLRVTPQITIEGYDSLYLTEPDEPAHLRLACDETTTIRQSPPQPGVDMKERGVSDNQREYALTAEAHIHQVTLQLAHETGVAMPLIIPIQRLRWSLHTGLTTDREMEWQTQPLSLFPGGLGLDAELRVMLPLFVGGPALHLGWRLLDAAGHIWREVPPDRQSLQRLLAFPMTEVLGLWREKRETLRWQLEILVEDKDEPVTVDALYLLPSLDLGEVLYDWQEDAGQAQLTLYWENPQPGRKQLRLWPLDRPWVERPVTLAMPETDVTLAEWQLSKSDLPAEAYLGEIAVYNPWASQQPERPGPERPNTILVKPPGLTQHYAEITRLRDLGQADAGQLLALFSHQFYNGQQHELHRTNEALMNQRGTLSLTWLVRWAETTHKLDNNAYKLAQFRMFEQAIIARLVQNGHPTDELEQYFRHLRDDKSFERVHLWVLQSGLRGPRRRCLESLCRLPLDNKEKERNFHMAMAALLEDVTNGSLLIGEAVTLLNENASAAAKYLAIQGSQDAAELLRELTHHAHLQPNWVWPKMILDTNVGLISVKNLRDRQTGPVRYCAPLSSSCYADGSLQLSPFILSVRLDLGNSLLHFNNHSPYQCQYCQQFFSDMSGYAQHHESMHAGQAQSRRRLKQDEKLTWIRPRLNEQIEEERL